MPDGREAEDARWQRLANLSIEIRMLKARAQAVFEGHENGASGTLVRDASCPHCGHTAGLSLLPREYRRQSTPVRCFACQRDSSAFDWAMQTRAAALDSTPQVSTRPPRH